MVAKRQGAQMTEKNKQLVAPTEQLLTMIANISTRLSSQIQVLAGSATASRKTLDRLNRSLQRQELSESSKIVTGQGKRYHHDDVKQQRQLGGKFN
jgi:hypothetical protein